MSDTITETSTTAMNGSDVLTRDQIEAKLHALANSVSLGDSDYAQAEQAYLANTHPSRFVSDEAERAVTQDELPYLEEAERLRDTSGGPLRDKTTTLIEKAWKLERRASKRRQEAEMARKMKAEGMVLIPPESWSR